MKRVLGIFRAACFSPGMVERDEAILRAVMTRLEERGYAVSFKHEEELVPDASMPDVVLHMTRSPQALDILQAWQERGCRVINAVEGVRGVERAALTRYCAEHRIPTPKTWIIDTATTELLVADTVEGVREEITFPCWVKRTGACAQEPDDVCRVGGAEEYALCLARFNARNIQQVVVMEHLDGVCVKFYRVGSDRLTSSDWRENGGGGENSCMQRREGFFSWIPAEKIGYDKWNSPGEGTSAMSSFLPQLEESEGASQSYMASAMSAFLLQLEESEGTPLMVYGGDVIIGADGVARLIDLNDWPSFSACREEASKEIAQLVMDMNKEF